MSTTPVGFPATDSRPVHPLHAAVLWGLLGLFCLRVAAQLAAAAGPLSFLPPFEAWHSGLLPYPALVAAQIAIVALYAWMARGIGSGRTRPRPGLGRLLLVLGGVYFAFMAARLLLGATALSGSSWWHAPIPSVFHLVLAGFLLVAGHFHASKP